jgi:hypothetical protein
LQGVVVAGVVVAGVVVAGSRRWNLAGVVVAGGRRCRGRHCKEVVVPFIFSQVHTLQVVRFIDLTLGGVPPRVSLVEFIDENVAT